ncbi:hypothetical protein ACAX43_29980 [Paraburkholderia sp. IW21]|uniref:hypothetical protein n=1 Tax=Paraburkholderia sp. IW21 TaxID=3242488 RepID=UPI00351FB709
MTEQELVDTVVAAKSESKMAIDSLIDAVTTAVKLSAVSTSGRREISAAISGESIRMYRPLRAMESRNGMRR